MDDPIYFLRKRLDGKMVPQGKLDDTKHHNLQKFLPENIQAQLLTAESISDCLPKIPAELLKFVTGKARKVFAIIVHSECCWRQYVEFLQLCQDLGFTDAELPISEADDRCAKGDEGSRHGSCKHERHLGIFHRGIWGNPHITEDRGFSAWNTFYEDQWRFLAPKFAHDRFVYEYPSGTILPIIGYGQGDGKGYFGSVSEAFLHPAHLTGVPEDITDPCRVAIKLFLDPDRVTDADMKAEKAFDKEKTAIAGTRAHEHIVRRVAAVTVGSRYYLISEWAAHGDLQNFWKNNAQIHVDHELMLELLSQVKGLADALHSLHRSSSSRKSMTDTSTAGLSTSLIPKIRVEDTTGATPQDAGSDAGHMRHGDVKPNNILVCSDPKRHPSRVRLGIWKLADLGLAKSHTSDTALRGRVTDTFHGTRDYEAPEVQTARQSPRPRAYDIWSVGCSLLETLVWLLYGYEAVELLQSFRPRSDDETRFYTITRKDKSVAVVNESINLVMDDILKNDPECKDLSQPTAARQLLMLVKEHLLVVELPSQTNLFLQNVRADSVRADSGTFLENMTSILNMATQSHLAGQSHRLWTGADRSAATIRFKTFLQDLKSSLLPDSQESQGQRPQTYLHPPLDPEEWHFGIDNAFANTAIEMLQTTSGCHYRLTPASLCQQCMDWTISLASSRVVNLAYIQRTTSHCALCALLHRLVVGNLPKERSTYSPEDVRLRRSGSRFVLEILGVERRALTLGQEYVHAANNPRNDVQISLPCMLESGSEAHMEILRQWLSDCDNDHKYCQPSESRSDFLLPTRLIDVRGESSPTIRILDTEDIPRRQIRDIRFAALSYPWGDPSKHRHDYCTTKSNYEQHKSGLKPSTLPSLLQQAIKVTRDLAIPYLWIDGLCIMQGEGGDFDQEAERMEDVFSAAYCVLAASRSTGVSDAFLGERPQPTIISIPGGRMFLREDIDDFKHDVIDGPLNKRGWVLQERALARRTIYFTETQTYWECGSSVRCETFTRMHNNQAAFLGDSHFPRRAKEGRRGLRILFWETLYEQYSKLLFSNYADRPIAIAGLERRLCREMGTDGGFGAFEEYFERSILWQRSTADDTKLTKIQQRSSYERVPSWSWLAYKGAIKFPELPFNGIDWTKSEYRSPWSATSSSRSSKTRLIRKTYDFQLRVLIRNFEQEPDNSGIVWDSDKPSDTLKCAVIGRLKEEAKLLSQKHYVLILKETAQKREYERVGMGVLAKNQIDYSESGEWVPIM